MKKYGSAVQATDDAIIRCMSFECSITKATDTNLECAIIIAIRLQKRFRDSALTLRLYVYCLPY